MPEGAFYDGLPAAAEIVAISCAWLTDEHPDPWGDALAAIGPPLQSLLEMTVQRARHAPWGSRPSDVAIFWDFMSLFQVERGRSQGGGGRNAAAGLGRGGRAG